jgi:hypothetical protein
MDGTIRSEPGLQGVARHVRAQTARCTRTMLRSDPDWVGRGNLTRKKAGLNGYSIARGTRSRCP